MSDTTLENPLDICRVVDTYTILDGCYPHVRDCIVSSTIAPSALEDGSAPSKEGP